MNKFLRKPYEIVIFLVLSITYSCETEPFDLNTGDERDNIADTWSCEENSSLYGITHYSVNIFKSTTDSTGIEIENFYDMGNNKKINAKLTGRTLQIPQQQTDGNTISGSGTVTSDYSEINLTYSVNDGSGEIDQVSATYSRVQ